MSAPTGTFYHSSFETLRANGPAIPESWWDWDPGAVVLRQPLMGRVANYDRGTLGESGGTVVKVGNAIGYKDGGFLVDESKPDATGVAGIITVERFYLNRLPAKKVDPALWYEFPWQIQIDSSSSPPRIVEISIPILLRPETEFFIKKPTPVVPYGRWVVAGTDVLKVGGDIPVAGEEFTVDSTVELWRGCIYKRVNRYGTLPEFATV